MTCSIDGVAGNGLVSGELAVSYPEEILSSTDVPRPRTTASGPILVVVAAVLGLAVLGLYFLESKTTTTSEDLRHHLSESVTRSRSAKGVLSRTFRVGGSDDFDQLTYRSRYSDTGESAERVESFSYEHPLMAPQEALVREVFDGIQTRREVHGELMAGLGRQPHSSKIVPTKNMSQLPHWQNFGLMLSDAHVVAPDGGGTVYESRMVLPSEAIGLPSELQWLTSFQEEATELLVRVSVVDDMVSKIEIQSGDLNGDGKVAIAGEVVIYFESS